MLIAIEPIPGHDYRARDSYQSDVGIAQRYDTNADPTPTMHILCMASLETVGIMIER
jgi:hypothetical protein